MNMIIFFQNDKTQIIVKFLLDWPFPMDWRVFHELGTLKNLVPGIIIGETFPVNLKIQKISKSVSEIVEHCDTINRILTSHGDHMAIDSHEDLGELRTLFLKEFLNPIK